MTRELWKHDCNYEFDSYCGARICLQCGDHQGLARCFCGFSRTSPGRGREELVEMGENIEDYPSDVLEEGEWRQASPPSRK